MKDVTREKMIEEMIDKVCRLYGFEAKQTIRFCTFCERSTNYNAIERKYYRLVDILHR